MSLSLSSTSSAYALRRGTSFLKFDRIDCDAFACVFDVVPCGERCVEANGFTRPFRHIKGMWEPASVLVTKEVLFRHQRRLIAGFGIDDLDLNITANKRKDLQEIDCSLQNAICNYYDNILSTQASEQGVLFNKFFT